MKILVEQSGYHLRNMGDLAMLQVALDRLRSFWPNAQITVFVYTHAAERLIEYCPNTLPLSPSGREIWFSPFLPRVGKLMTGYRATHQWTKLEWKLRQHSPSLVRSFVKFKLKRKLDQAKEFEAFMSAVYDANLVVATGGGYITSTFKQSAISALVTLDLAARLGKPTVMFGQGIGPILDQELLSKATTVLPKVDLITLREKRAAMPLLASIGVSKERVITTGDDAIELAYKSRNANIGNGIGVNLRIAEYSEISLSIIEIIRETIHDFAQKHNAPLLPVPIDHLFYEGYADSDSMTIQKLLKGYDDTSDGGESLNTPVKIIEQISNCRVVVTGSYHAGVFALSQGIPVVSLVKSKYYLDKFMGLADQFGIGCEVILLNDQQFKEKLVARINNVWEASEQLRPELLEAAQRQIDLANAAYKRVYELVSSR